MDGQVGPFRKVLSQQSVGVFVAAALPGALGIAEVHFHIRGHCEVLVLGHLQSAIPGQRPSQRCWKFLNVLAQRGHNRGGVFAGHLDQGDKTRMAFHQSGDRTVVGAADQIALPMTGNGAILDLSWPFPDGNGLDDLTAVISAIPGMP